VDNDVARVAQLIAVAVLPPLAGITGASYLQPAELAAGFRTAVFIAAGACVAGGVLAALTIRNPAAAPPATQRLATERHCGLDAPPLRAGGRERTRA
jgi:hypothetical protein